jgi:hypothetical protein
MHWLYFWGISFNVKPWKIITPSNSKHTTLLVMLAFDIPPKTRE